MLPKNPWQVHWCQFWGSHQNQAQVSRWWYGSLGLFFHWTPASIKSIINWSQCGFFVRLLHKETFTSCTKMAFAAEFKFPNAKEACFPFRTHNYGSTTVKKRGAAVEEETKLFEHSFFPRFEFLVSIGPIGFHFFTSYWSDFFLSSFFK